MKSSTKRSFTLIELLIVVVILGILASLLLPALRRAKALALTADCANNQKQFGISVHLFCDDHDGYLPNSIYNQNQASPYEDELFPPQSALSSTWLGYAHPSKSNNFWQYFSDSEGAACRSHPMYATTHERFVNNRSSLSQWWWSAGNYKVAAQHWSVWYFNSGNSNYYLEKRRLGDVRDSSQIFMAMEGTSTLESIRNNYSSRGYSSAYPRFGYHHNLNTGFNGLFFDGHVSFFKLKHDVTYSDYVYNFFTTDEIGKQNFE